MTVTQQACMFRTMPFVGPPVGVDRNRNAIMGVTVVQLGDVRDDRPWTVDDDTLARVVELGNQPNRGIKSRFAHPSMSDDGLGRHLGRLQAFRRDGKRVRADLLFDDTAFATPDGDLATYLMDLADSDPEAFAMSMAIKVDEEAMFTSEGELQAGPLRIDRLRAVDVVGEGAATDGLFSVQSFDAAHLPAIVERIIAQHFSDASPDDLRRRFDQFLSRQFGVSEMSESTTTATPPVDIREESRPFVEAFGAKGAEWFLEGISYEEAQRRHFAAREEDLTAQLGERDARIADLQEQFADLEKRFDALRVAAGESEPVDFSEAGEADPEAERIAKETSRLQPRVGEAVAKFAARRGVVK